MFHTTRMSTVTHFSPLLFSYAQTVAVKPVTVERRCFRNRGGLIRRRHNNDVSCCALENEGSQGDTTVYQGVYGPWTIEESDTREVLLYRGGLVSSTLSLVIAASSAFLPDEFPGKFFIQENLDVFYALGAGSLGLSLTLIHIYVAPLKRTLQLLWTLGAVGSLVLYWMFAQPEGKGIVQYVIEYPSAVWFVGPLFASLTGLVFKEGLCYGKLEAGILTLVIPTILLGHLTGLLDDQSKLALLGTSMALFSVFACRKFTQPIKDDIGDKSIFMFNSFSEEEKKAFLEGRGET